jgi:hypothetical protein
MRGSIRVAVAAAIALLGLGSPAHAAPGVVSPGIGMNFCDGFTGTCTNPLYVRTVALRANEFRPAEGGPPFPKRWTVGRVKLAESQDLGGDGEVFAVGHLRVRPFATPFIGVSTVAWGRFVNSGNPDYPYRFEGFTITHDPDILRNQDFEFIGEQLADPPPPPENRNDR